MECERQIRQGIAGRRLYLEPLETRTLLATITVTSLADTVSADGQVTLREAIQAANTNAAVDGSAAGQAAPVVDQIVFQPGLTGTISLGALGQLAVTETAVVQGLGWASTIIDANGASRVFYVTDLAADVTFSGMTVTNGLTNEYEGGGGIHSDSPGSLSLIECRIIGNKAPTGDGGGVSTLGSMTVTNSTISRNSAGYGGGISAEAVTLTNSTISMNSSVGIGAGIVAYRSVTVVNSTVSDNLSDFRGGGVYALGSATVTNSTISDNQTIEGDGGGLYADGTVLVTGSTISGNEARKGSGGGIFARGSVTVSSSTISNNFIIDTSGSGGSIYAEDACTIRNSIVASTVLTSDGPKPDLHVAGTLVVQASLIANNAGTSLSASATPDANGNLIGTPSAPIQPVLGQLANYGGVTRTRAFLPGSPGLDLGKISHAKAILATPGLVAFYRFEETAGTVADDAANLATTLNGTYANGVVLGAKNTLATGDAGNTLGNVATFDGQNDQVVLPPVVIPTGFDSITIAFWVNTTQASASGNSWRQGKGLVDRNPSGWVPDFGTSQLNGKFAFGVGPEDTTVQSAQTINDGRWHHVVATRVGYSGALAVYVDGALGGTATGPGGTMILPDGLVVGSLEFDTNFFAGQIDELALFSRALAADEIFSLYQAEVPAASDQRGVPFARVNGLRDAGAYEQQTLSPLSLLVDTAADEYDFDFAAGDLSLREALGLANGSLGANTVSFAPVVDGPPLLLTQGQLEISEALTIQGNGAASTIIDAQRRSRVFEVTSGDVTFGNMTIRNGRADVIIPRSSYAFGGGIYSTSLTDSLTVTGSVISGNTAELVLDPASLETAHVSGGGIFAQGPVTVVNSTISGNTATASGFSGNASGGGISAREALIVTNSTISNNTATATGFDSRAQGGGILYGGGFLPNSRVQVTHSTISQNAVSATGIQAVAYGGGMLTYGDLLLVQSTVTGNLRSGSSGNAGGMLGLYDMTILNSIVAGNIDADGSHPELETDGTLIVRGSLIGDNNGVGLPEAPASSPDTNGNLIGTHAAPIDPKLGLLADNGGSTLTHALLHGSPALNRGINALAVDPDTNAPLTADQRGLRRIIGKSVDMGAVEKQHVWHNTVHGLDVIGGGDGTGPADGQVVAGDALAVINYININRAGPVPDNAKSGPPFYDTDDDDFVSPGDALAIINFINANGSGLPGPAGEGEALSADDLSRLLEILADDRAAMKKRAGLLPRLA